MSGRAGQWRTEDGLAWNEPVRVGGRLLAPGAWREAGPSGQTLAAWGYGVSLADSAISALERSMEVPDPIEAGFFANSAVRLASLSLDVFLARIRDDGEDRAAAELAVVAARRLRVTAEWLRGDDPQLRCGAVRALGSELAAWRQVVAAGAQGIDALGAAHGTRDPRLRRERCARATRFFRRAGLALQGAPLAREEEWRSVALLLASAITVAGGCAPSDGEPWR